MVVMHTFQFDWLPWQQKTTMKKKKKKKKTTTKKQQTYKLKDQLLKSPMAGKAETFHGQVGSDCINNLHGLGDFKFVVFFFMKIGY